MVDASIEDWRTCVDWERDDWKLSRALGNLLGRSHSLSPLNVVCSEDDRVAMNKVEFRSGGDAVLVWASSFKQALGVVIEVSELFRELGQQVVAIPSRSAYDEFTEEQAALVIAWAFRLCDLLEDVTLEELDEVVPETVTVTGDLNAVADFGKVYVRVVQAMGLLMDLQYAAAKVAGCMGRYDVSDGALEAHASW